MTSQLCENLSPLSDFELIGEGGIKNLYRSEDGDILANFYNDGDTTVNHGRIMRRSYRFLKIY